jgi:ribosomal protein S18 acetylase RimI-like enzyme
MILKAADNVSFYDFIRAFNQAYADYYTDIVLNERSMNGLILRDAIDLSASVAAVDGDRIVGVAMLAIRGTSGWIGGVGVVPSRRGQGIGRAMMDYLLDKAKQRGLERVYLEVIIDNKRAFKLYNSLGFAVTRRLSILNRSPGPASPSPSIQLNSMAISDALDLFDTYHPVRNPWQRSKQALLDLSFGGHVWQATAPGNPQDTLAFCMSQMLGYDTIRIIDLGISPAHPDPERLTFELFSSIHAEMPDFETSILNHAEDHPGTPALRRLGYVEILAQHEMMINV